MDCLISDESAIMILLLKSLHLFWANMMKQATLESSIVGSICFEKKRINRKLSRVLSCVCVAVRHVQVNWKSVILEFPTTTFQLTCFLIASGVEQRLGMRKNKKWQWTTKRA